MELLRYWKVIQKSLWIVLAVVAVGIAATTAFTLTRRTEYESTATLLLNPSVPSSLVPYVQTQVAANLADSYTQLMRTRSFGESVVKELSFQMPAGQVAGAITTQLQPNTLFYKITARMGDPLQSQELVKTVLKIFLSANAAQQQQAGDLSGSTSLKTDLRKRLEDKLTYLGDQIKSYQTQISDLGKQPVSRDRDDQILQMRGQLVTLQQAETDAMVAMSQMSDASTAPNTALTIDQPLPGLPVSNRLLTNLLLALFVSLLIGVGVAFLRDYLDYTVHSPEEMEEMLGLSPLAALGSVGSADAPSYGRGRRNGAENGDHGKKNGKGTGDKLAGHKLVTLEHPRSPDAESFRVLRTNIQFSSVDKSIRTLVITSAGPGEGKSFTASNLAIVMAQAGKRTILVDADLRKPSLHKLFELPNSGGLTTLVVSKPGTLEGIIQNIPGIENLAVITSGPIPPNPSEILNSRQAIEVMEMLSGHADVVIYDTPPAGVVTDATILATRADAVLLVVSAGATRRDLIARCKQNLLKVGVSTILPVLNRVKIRNLQGYYYYYRYYGSELPAASNGHSPKANGKVLGRSSGRDAVLASATSTSVTPETSAPGTTSAQDTIDRS